MKSYLDCIPCFVRQTLEVVRLVTDDETIHEEVLRSVLREASDRDLNETPPSMAQRIHRLIREKSGVNDPYREIKHRFNQEILTYYDDFQTRINQSPEPLETAIRLAIAGNIIDVGANSYMDNFVIHNAINRAEIDPLIWDQEEFLKAVDNAQTILYLADNAGEIVFDRLLIERLPKEKITVAVRGFPILNDATYTDAREVGLTGWVEVIDNGSDAPGSILADCKNEFVERFNQSDLIVSKGQGNYETLSDVEKDIFFMLKAKCPVIARHIGCKVGDMIFQRSTSPIHSEGK